MLLILVVRSIGLSVLIAVASFATSDGAHHHSKLGDVTEEVLANVRIVAVTLEAGVKKEDFAKSRDGKYEAFTLFREGPESNRIFFTDKGTGKIYEISGLALSHRPFSDLEWLNNRTLVFDRWSQPHYGIHYVVDVKKRKVMSAAAFPD